ncbi:Mpv17-like protein [Dirofilaria immitis]
MQKILLSSDKKLLLTNTAITCSLLGISDTLQQWISNDFKLDQNKPINVARTKRFATMGLIIGPMCHFWYKWLEKTIIHGTKATIASKKIACDILVSPIFGSIFISGLALLEGNSIIDATAEYRRKFIRIFTLDICVWPSTQLINFWFLPLKYRTAVYNPYLKSHHFSFIAYIINIPKKKKKEMSNERLIILASDVIFHPSNYISNQTLKLEHGNKANFLVSLIFLSFYLTTILLNSYLLCLNIRCVDYRRYKRLPLLIINFAISNIILATGFLLYTLIIGNDNINIITDKNVKDGINWTYFTVLKDILRYQIVHNFGNIQSLFLLYLAADSYFSLFMDHNPNHHSLILAILLLSFPYIISILIIDMRFLQLFITTASAIVVYLLILILVPSFSFLLTICAIIRQCQIKSPFWIQNRSVTVALLIITILQLLEKWGLAVELFEINFKIIFVVDNIDNDCNLRIILNNWYKIAHGLVLLMPFLSVLIFLLIVGSYRQQTIEHFRQCWQWIRCKRIDDNKIDYNVETMYSIITERTRQRQLHNYSSNIEIF